MILEEIIDIFVWLMNAEGPEGARDLNAKEDDENFREYPPDNTRLLWLDRIDKEYPEAVQQSNQYQVLQNAVEVYARPVENVEEARPKTFLRSVAKSVWTSFTIMLVAILVAVVAILTLYFDLNTTNLCLKTKNENTSISFSVKRWQFVGDSIQTFPINLWFAATIALLFGWREFKANFLVTVAIGLATGAVVIIYKAFALIFGLFGKGFVYGFPGNVIYFVGVLCSSVIVARKIHELRPRFQCNKKKIGLIIATPFALAFVWALLYRYCIVPTFNSIDDELNKAIVAIISPMMNIPAIAIVNYIALRASCGMVYVERSFLFVYFTQSIPISLYRIMQAEFKSLWLFTGLSLLHGGLIVIFHATRSLRIKMWRFVIERARRSCVCCGRRGNVPFDTAQNRRLNADLEIQMMLFQYIAFILSQAFIVLSQFEVTEVSLTEGLLRQNVHIRLAIGIGIELFFNCIAIFIQIHFHDTPIKRLWSTYWLRHLIASVMLMTVTMCFFAPVMLSIFQVPMDHSHIRNCSMPFGIS